MFTFYFENHKPFGRLTKNCPKLDKNKSIVSRYSIFVVYKSAVSTVQKSNYSMFQATWTTFKFNRDQLGTVLAYVM